MLLSYTQWFIYNIRYKIIKETKDNEIHTYIDIPKFPIYIQSYQIIYLTRYISCTPRIQAMLGYKEKGELVKIDY